MIRLLREEDADSYTTLRREALIEAPLAFAASLDDDLACDAEAVREQIRRSTESVIFGAFRERLVDTVGLYRDRHLKSAHKVHLWGMYVTPAHRRQGLALALLRAALQHAPSMPGISLVHLSVTSAAPEARRLYEATGFTAWGEEPDALRWNGRSVSELHLGFRLAGASPR